MGSRHFNTYQLKHFILLLCLMLLFSASQAQKNTFIRTYNLPGMNGGLDLALLSDGGFVGTGQHADGGGTCRVYAYRIDECGNLIWFNLYASGGGIAINETQNDGIIIGGEMDGHGASLLKVDNIGGIEWSKYYSGMGNYMCSAIETSNGSFFIGGEGVIAKTNQQGDVLWSANVAPGKVHSVDEFSNGDYLYLSLSLTGATFYLGRVSANGFLIWENSYGQPGGTYDSHYDWAGDAMIDKNDNIIVTSNSDNDNGNIVISKLDGNGNVMIAKDVGSSSSTDLVRSIAEGLNDGFILGGATYGYNTSSVSQITQNIAHAPENLSGRDILLLKFDDLLNLEWSSVIGSSGSDKGIGVRANNDNGYTISAYTDGTFFNANSFDPLFIKTDSVGSVGCQQYSPNLPESSITLNKITTTFFSSSSIVEANFTPTTTNISPSDYFMCLDCSTVPSFYISDTTICVGDTTFFINESSGLLCFQDWYVDGQLIQADTDSIPFVFDVGGLHTIELVTNCGNGSVSFILDIYVNYIDFQITSQSDFNGFEVSCYDFNDGFIETIATSPYPPITFNWTGGATTSNVYNLTSDDYFLNITDDFGCTIDTVVEVTQPDAITNTIQSLFDYNGYDISCYNLNDGEIFSNTIGGVSPYSYTWAGPNGYTSNTEDINSLYAGTYFLNIVDDNGCIYNSNINLNEPSNITSILTSTTDYNGYDISCFGALDGGVSSVVNGGIIPYNLLWDNGQTSASLTNLPSGSYQLSITDLNGCISTSSISLIEPLELTSSIQSSNNYNGYDISCIGMLDGGAQVSVAGGVSPYDYTWNTGAVSQNLNNISAGQYSVTITDENGCINFQDIILTEPTPFSSSFSDSDYNGYDISCHNFNDGWIDFTIGGSVSPYSYTWAGPNGYTSNTEDINSLYAGTYFLNIVDDNGCIYNSNINLNEPEGVNAYVVTAPDTCSKGIGFAEVIYSGGVPPIAFLWDDKTTLSYNSSLSSGENLVLLTDGNTCVYEIYFNINNLVGPVADFSASGYSYDFFEQLEQEINFYDSSYDEWSNIDSWNWDVGDQTIYFNQDISHSYDSIGQYYVQLIIENVSGCRDTIIKMVNIKGYKVHIPNSFTPHNDEINNVFKPVGVGIESYEMTIYNRWGERLYSTKEIAMGWNGMYEGRKVQAGVYAYKISVIDVFGESHFYTGEIHLIR